MKMDLRILTVGLGFMIVAASAVVLVKYPSSANPVSVVEVIPPKGSVSTERLQAGLQLQISPKGLTLSLPDCDTTSYQDKFFLHLYTDVYNEKVPVRYINLDFYLGQEKGKESQSNGRRKCDYFKSFGDFSVKGVSVGQFTTPNGRCCDVTWSRSFIFEERLPATR